MPDDGTVPQNKPRDLCRQCRQRKRVLGRQLCVPCAEERAAENA